MAKRKPTPSFVLGGVDGLQLGGNNVRAYFGDKPAIETVLIQGTDMIYGGETTNIPRNGLVLYVNANENSSYPGSGSTWYDLSVEGNDLTLDASPTFVTGTPNHFDFTDGTDAARYLVAGTASAVTSQDKQYTVCMFNTWYSSNATYRTLWRTSNPSEYPIEAQDSILTNTGTDNLGVYSESGS